MLAAATAPPQWRRVESIMPNGPLAALARAQALRIHAGKGYNFLALDVGKSYFSSEVSAMSSKVSAKQTQKSL